MLAARHERLRAERDAANPPSEALRSLRARRSDCYEGHRVHLAGGFWVYTDGDWFRQPRAVRREIVDAAVAAMGEVQRKFDATPEWQVIIDQFGEQGAVRDAQGRVVGYRYPRHADPDRNLRQSHEVMEMFEPALRVEEEIGYNASAAAPAVTLVNEFTQQTVQAHPAKAERSAKRAGMVEKRKRLKRSSK